MGHVIGYIRVSSTGQNTDRQLDGIECDETYEDTASGGSADRPKLKEMILRTRKGDTIKVHSIDRLARNLADLESIVGQLTTKGATVHFVKEGLTFKAKVKDGKEDPMSTLMLQMMGAFAQFERSMINERQREGIALAKAAGKYKGRVPSLTEEQKTAIRTRAQAGESKVALSAEYGVSRQTIYSALSQ